MSNLDNLSVNAIRVLSADAIQKANSGHPGLPLGAAPMAYTLWTRQLKHNPANPNWVNRDRFILSAGHGSMLLYSLLHLFGYGNLKASDLASFRQLGSLTPGHPEYGHTVGVEATTGPLGAGMAMAVGMAIAESHLAAEFNQEGFPIVDHYTYVLGGDGCMMEGTSSEAFSLAGTLGLSKLIVLYDSNNISIEGSTDIAFTEDVQKRMEAFGFQLITVEDGNDLDAINAAIEEAKADHTRPSFITVKTKIGYGSPKAGTASAHGEPLGVDNVAALRKNLEWPCEEPFVVPEEVYDHFNSLKPSLANAEEEWNKLFDAYSKKFPELRKQWDAHFDKHIADAYFESDAYLAHEDKPMATRNVSGDILNKLKDVIPALMGGSADLAPSNKTNLKEAGDYSKNNYAGRNMHFGVRELAMAAIGNGMMLHGGVQSYVATFFVFSDYLKPMARLSALMGLPLTYVLTHDSIGVGEDGPTHEPIEQLATFRAMPNFSTFRPCDYVETAAAWQFAIQSEKTPTALVLSRQNLPQMPGSDKCGAMKGGYVISPAKNEAKAILIASGSEVSLAVAAQEALAADGIDVSVVSMPCMDEFEKQSAAYKESVLPKNIRARVAVEALSTFGWERYVGLDGKVVGMETFGASGPAATLFEHFGFTVGNVVKAVKDVL